MDEYDRRLYHRILQVLKYPLENRNSIQDLEYLNDVVQSLLFLKRCLHKPEREYDNVFANEWWQLEESLAVALEEKQELLSADETVQVTLSLSRLVEITQKQLGNAQENDWN